MQILVINRTEDRERRERVATQLEAFCLPFEFFPALSGEAAVQGGVFERYDEDEFLLNTGRPITAGEIGCYASHAALWRRSVRNNEALLIMEDDFDLLPGFRDAVQTAAKLVARGGFIRLQTDLRARRRPVLRHKGFTLSRFSKAPHALMCYAISPAAARRLLACSRVFDAPVDVMIKKFWEHGQPLHALTPYTVAPSVLSTQTTILGRHKGRRRARVQIRRFFRKGRWHLQRARQNLKWRLADRALPRTLKEAENPAAL